MVGRIDFDELGGFLITAAGFGTIGYLGAKIITYLSPRTSSYLNPRLAFMPPFIMAAALLTTLFLNFKSDTWDLLIIGSGACACIGVCMAKGLPFAAAIATSSLTLVPIGLFFLYIAFE
jgi:hypothetical protein